MTRIDKTITERFNQKYVIDEITKCWNWVASKDGCGYGQIKYRGAKKRAHRVSYLINKGMIPQGMLVCHTCDNPSCVNPDHLFLGTPLDNTRDMINKGRNRPPNQEGKNNNNAKLSDDDIKEIKLMISNGDSNKDIALNFNVTHSMISLIRLGKAWAA